jgi:hypothetical protein
MSIKKMLTIVVAVALLAAPAFAGKQPEYDAVGIDKSNYFVQGHPMPFEMVNQRNVLLHPSVPGGEFQLEAYSAFWKWVEVDTECCGPEMKLVMIESFSSSAGDVLFDPCFPPFAYQFSFRLDDNENGVMGAPPNIYNVFEDTHIPGGDGGRLNILVDWHTSVLTDKYNEGTYRWYIVLQKKPESDIDVNIVDCVLQHNEYDPFLTGAPWYAPEQTGRIILDGLSTFGNIFIASANPSITVTAYPGPNASPGFADEHGEDGMVLQTRKMPSLELCDLAGLIYTSKAIWEEGLIAALPDPQRVPTNDAGQKMFVLKQGDVICIDITIPFNNTADIRYGKDNIILKYIGFRGTDYIGECYIPDGD